LSIGGADSPTSELVLINLAFVVCRNRSTASLTRCIHGAYGMDDGVALLAFLLELNLARAAKEKATEKVTRPEVCRCQV
jgi:hypothetical protein